MYTLKSRNYFLHWLSIISLCFIILFPLSLKSQDISKTIVTTENEQHVFENKNQEFSVSIFEDGKLKSHFVEDPDSIMNVIIIFHDPPARTKIKQGLATTASIQTTHQTFQNELNKIVQSIEKNEGVEIAQPKIKHKYVYAINGMAIQTTRRVIDQLYTHPMVASVHPDGEVKALINENAKFVGADSARAKYNVTGKGVLVGVLDTGVDYFHDALGGGIGVNFRVIGGYDFIEDDNDPMDEHGHGTWVSGIIGGSGDSLTGMAPEVNFLAVRVLDDWGYGQNSGIIAGIEYCLDPDGNPLTDDGVDIINMSLGDSEGDANDPMSLAVNNAFANGVLCVAAAGNEGIEGWIGSPFNTISSPGSAEHALTVGASDLNDEITWFSSKGPAPGSFGIKPEIVAPGFEITSTYLDNGFGEGSGTSASSPVVAGAAALLLEHYPDWDNTQIKSALINSAKRLFSVESPYIQGNGRLDVVKSFEQSLLCSPAVVSFGIVDLAKDLWESEISLIVNNPTDSSIILSLYPPEWITGITFNLSKDNFTLNPGESDSLIVSIQVSKEVPFVNDDPFSYYGDIVCVANTDTFTVPCGFTKARLLIIETSRLSRFLIIWNEDLSKVNIIRNKKRVSVPLEAGNYGVFSVMKTSGSDLYTHIYLVEEKDVSVENLTYLNMDHRSAIFETPQIYYGKDGNELDAEHFQSIYFKTRWSREYETETENPIRVSVSVSYSLSDKRQIIHSMPLDENYTYFYSIIHQNSNLGGPITTMQKFKRGIESNEDLSLRDGSNGLKRFNIQLPVPTLNSYNVQPFIGDLIVEEGSESLKSYHWKTGNSLIVDIAYDASKLNNDPIYNCFIIGYSKEEDNYMGWPFMFSNPGIFVNVEGELIMFHKDRSRCNNFVHLDTYKEGDTLYFPSISSDVLIPNLSIYWDDQNLRLENKDWLAPNGIHTSRGYFDIGPDVHPFSNRAITSYLFGDGVFKYKYKYGLLGKWRFSETVPNEFQFNIQTLPYEILGQYGNSSLSLNGKIVNNWKKALSLFHFDIRSGDKIRQWVSAGENNKINFHIRNSDINLSFIKVILINELAEEREIEVLHVDGIQYSANIPDDLTSGFYGVHLIATDQYQEPMEFIADPAFYFAPKDEAPTPHASLSVENYYPIDSTYYTVQPDTNDLLTVDIKNIGVETAYNIKYYIEDNTSIGVYTNDTVDVVGIYSDSIKQVQIPIFTTITLPVDSLVRVKLITEWESSGELYKRRFYLTLGTAKVPTSVNDIDNFIVKDFVIYQNYPNPFNPISKIGFNIPKSGNVKLNIYNVLGELVTELVNEYLDAGFHQYEFNGSNLTSGVYFYKIQSRSFTDIKKMLLIK